jgi:hypothetical protein
MINQTYPNNQVCTEMKMAFKELKISKHLKDAGFKKQFGFSPLYLFEVIFCLVFLHKNYYRLLSSAQGKSFPGKDSIYRFLNCPKFPWRRFLLNLSSYIITNVAKLTSPKRLKVFIVDDSTYSRDRSKKVELLARFKDHVDNCYYKGFRMLTFGWSDGHTFVPMDFSLLSSSNSQLNGMREDIDKRTSGYQRRIEALKGAPANIPLMLDRALDKGVSASYVLMDSWFTHAPLVRQILQRGLDVIGMVKDTSQRYLINGKMIKLEKLYHEAKPIKVEHKRTILRSITTQLSADIKVKVVFVRHDNHKDRWLAVLSTDTSLSETKIIDIYGLRWDIETFFKFTKSFLELQKEFQGRSYDLMISHTTICFSRYIMLSWQRRKNTDDRTIGGLFFLMCDEILASDWKIALNQLLMILDFVANSFGAAIKNLIKSQLSFWIANLPPFIKDSLCLSLCES